MADCVKKCVWNCAGDIVGVCSTCNGKVVGNDVNFIIWSGYLRWYGVMVAWMISKSPRPPKSRAPSGLFFYGQIKYQYQCWNHLF